ncbi:MAG: tRNA threonylcarbamoyladenosine dehydratase [Flavobacteriia bacterium]|nr:tRNA threonylcarbamoyladenosine dehydratase [Flavobacteriia bacterium]
MEDFWLERTELLIKKSNLEKLRNKHVLIIGLGGIGSFAAEFIARSGINQITLIDGDVFDVTNKNRQLTALNSTIGKNKASVLADRIKDISSDIKINVLQEFVVPERVWEILEQYKPDIVLECIDSLSPKTEWIIACLRKKIKVITHLGAGGKMDPSKVKVSSLDVTHNCKLGHYLKKRLKSKGVSCKKVRAVFSEELQNKNALKLTNGLNFKKSYYGTNSYMPALFGLFGAAEAIRYLLLDKK